MAELYGATPADGQNLGKIVGERQMTRLVGLLKETKGEVRGDTADWVDMRGCMRELETGARCTLADCSSCCHCCAVPLATADIVALPLSVLARLTLSLLSQFITGGADQHDTNTRYIAPTVVKVEMDDALMQDEIFGPILAVSDKA